MAAFNFTCGAEHVRTRCVEGQKLLGAGVLLPSQGFPVCVIIVGMRGPLPQCSKHARNLFGDLQLIEKL